MQARTSGSGMRRNTAADLFLMRFQLVEGIKTTAEQEYCSKVTYRPQSPMPFAAVSRC